jgi:hypothetical protein
MIERKIIIALIVSTEYLQKMQDILNPSIIQSQVARKLAEWCFQYFEKYRKAPNRDIETIYYNKLKSDKRLSKDIAEEIEQDILPSLSDEYEQDGVNVDYLIKQTEDYITERSLDNHQKTIRGLLDEGKLLEAEQLARSFKPPLLRQETGINLSDEKVLDKIEDAFNIDHQRLIEYTHALGEFWNDQLVRNAFVVFMGIEKRGKTFLLIDVAMKAIEQNLRVAFFEAGDMSENELIKRIAVYLARKSNIKKYSGKIFEPVKDCIFNQTDNCDREARECNFGVFTKKTEEEIRSGITFAELKRALKANPNYKPCYNCKEYTRNKWGTVWLKE